MGKLWEWLDPGGGDRKGQLAIIGGLIVIIVGALVGAGVMIFGASETTGDPKDLHFWDVQAKQEVVLKPADLARDGSDWEDSFDPDDRGLVTNPKTGKRTLQPMMRCRSCGRYFVPDPWKGDPSGMVMDPSTAPRKIVCKHCGAEVR